MVRFLSIRPAFTSLLISASVALFSSGLAHASTDFEQCGKASWYKLRGKTASGEAADPDGLTAAHRTLPFGTLATVTNLSNGQSVVVRINDRGPYAKGRVIDVTQAAAQKLGMINQGIARVKVTGKTPKSSKVPPKNCQ